MIQKNKVVGITAFEHDIAMQKHAEEKIPKLKRIYARKKAVESHRESSQNLRLILDSIPAFVFWKDRNCIYLGCNSLFAANAGLSSPEEIIGLTDFDLPWKDTEAERYRADDRMVMETGIPRISYEETQFTVDGHVNNVRTSKIPLRDHEGEIIGILGTFEDITEHNLAEKALRESEQKFRSLAESTPDNIIRYDNNCRAVYVNHNMVKTVNSNSSELIDKTPLEFGPEKSSVVEDYQSKLQNVILTGNPDILEIVIPNVYGEMQTHHVRLVAERDSEGKIVGALAIGRDITERKQVEKEILRLNQELEQRVASRTSQLEIVNKELEAFAYSVSHDLRAPLRGIDGFSQALIDDYREKLDEKGISYLNRIRVASQRMAQLIDDMLSLSRISRSEMMKQTVNLSEMFSKIVNDFRDTQPERKIRFVIKKGLMVQGDGRLLRLVLENLVDNALKFTSKHSEACIKFGVKQKKGSPVYFISDDGAGFDMNYAQNLFSAFTRLHTATEFPGTGIGLAIVQRVIHRHGGKVWAEGEIEKGATFYFTLK